MSELENDALKGQAEELIAGANSEGSAERRKKILTGDKAVEARTLGAISKAHQIEMVKEKNGGKYNTEQTLE